MKKYGLLFLMVFLIALEGCNGKQPDVGTEGTNLEQEDVTPVTPDVPEVTILDDKKSLDDQEILSYIYNEYIEDDMQQQIYNFQENLLISSSSYNGKTGESSFKLELISTQTGELIKGMEQNQVEVPLIQILDRHVILSDIVTGKVIVINSDFEVENEYEVAPGSVFLNKMMTKAYVIDQKEGILVVDLADGTSTRIMKEIAEAYISKVCGDYVALAYTDGKTGVSGNAFLNLASEEVDILDLNKSLYGVERNSRMWLAGLVGENNKFLYGSEEVPQILITEDSWMPSLVMNSDELLMSLVKDDGSLDIRAYYPDGRFLSQINLPGGTVGYWGNLVKFESLHGYLFTSIDENGIDKLYHWDLSVGKEGQNLVLEEMKEEGQAGEAVSDDLYEKAKRIGDKYGVTIKIADQCDTEYDSYTVEQNLNVDKIERGLDIIDLSLASYPEGFIKQLYFGYFRKIEINLMGNIYAINQVEENKSGFDSFIAFVQQDAEKYIMVFDLSRGQLMEQDLYHEFSHIIDKKLQSLVDQNKKVKYSEEAWAKLNPSGFDYSYSYTDVPSSYYYDGYDDYFIDIYSRTFPTEDRARVLEYAMIGAEFCFDTYPALLDKLSFYCECIRDGFDTTGWPEVTKWEEMLFLVD